MKMDTCCLYPLRGFAYFFTHPVLWGNLCLLSVPQVLITVSVFVVAYAFLYPPQAALAFILNGPAGPVATFISMFQQASAINLSISQMFLYPKALYILFDGVLTEEGMDSIILNGKMSAPPAFEESDYRRTVNWFKTVPRKLLLPKWLVMIIFRFAISFIPIIGPMILIYLDAPGTTQRCLGRYFELKGYDKTMIDAFIRRHKTKWSAFGISATILEAIPFIGFVFLFTNTAAGALWACKLEKEEMKKMKNGKMLMGNRNKIRYSMGI